MSEATKPEASEDREPVGSPWPRRLRSALILYVLWTLVLGIIGPVAISAGVRIGPGAGPELLSPRARAVEFPTSDGLTLRGLYVEPEGDRPVLLLLHGIRANRRDLIPWARAFVRAGYGVLAFDWRGHGESDGWWIAYGVDEGEDLAAADRFLDSRPELAGRPRGVWAVSLGAAMTALNADRFGPEYRCMILDSPYGDLERMLDYRFSVFGPFAWLPGQVIRLTGGLWLGRSLATMRPEEGLKAFAPRPLLVMHGEADRTIPFSEGKAVFEAYPGPKQAWFTEHGHTESRWSAQQEWCERVGSFLAAHLPGAPPASSLKVGG